MLLSNLFLKCRHFKGMTATANHRMSELPCVNEGAKQMKLCELYLKSCVIIAFVLSYVFS